MTKFIQHIGKQNTLVRKVESGGKEIVKPNEVFEVSDTIAIDLLHVYPELFIAAEKPEKKEVPKAEKKESKPKK